MRYFLAPLVLILVHATLVALVGADIALSPDPETQMAWCLFFFIDFPLSLFIFAPPPTFASTVDSFALSILVLGTIQWAVVGIGIQTLVNWFRRSRHAGKGAEHGKKSNRSGAKTESERLR
jgi:hypothetical protein